MSRRTAIAENAEPWAKLATESPQAFSAFVGYKNLGSARSLDRLATQLGRDEGRRVPGRLYSWSRAHRWVERASAWDRHLQDERDRIAVAEARKWEKRRQQALESNWEAAQGLRAKLKQMLAFPISRTKIEDGKTIVEPGKWSFQTTVLIAKTIAEIEVAVLTAANVDVDQLTDPQIRLYAADAPETPDIAG